MMDGWREARYALMTLVWEIVLMIMKMGSVGDKD